MENIYKIKVRTKFDPRWLYPSERRYSASIILGLGVVHLALAITEFLLACLTLNYDETSSVPMTNLHGIDLTNVLTFTPCIAALGALGAGLTALLAWKRWYIDHNITWFFCMSLSSIITSSISLGLVVILIGSVSFNDNRKNVRFILTLNILIATISEWLWSCVSTKVSYVGMRNVYPDDIKTQQDVSTVVIKNKKNHIIPPDLLNHFSPDVSQKLAKYLIDSNTKVKSNELPKDESHSEYRERVNKFLTSLNDS